MPHRWRGGKRRTKDQDASGSVIALITVLVLGAGAGAVKTWLAQWWPLLALVLLTLLALLVWRTAVRHRRARAAAAHQAVLDGEVSSTDVMSGSEFEHLVARLLTRDGWRQVTVSGGAGDLGADVTARHPVSGALLVVQCKRYSNRAVSSPDMQRFLGTVFHHHHADHALFVTTSYYSRPAAALAASSGVHVLDRRALATWMHGQPLALPSPVARR